ncbi:hypothetical protein K4F52_007771 [Lecanicillium sp. MT-2017a]|nr:hypothetical protein K4F52_007771 [Lecanicillium sp. MT-2017a]
MRPTNYLPSNGMLLAVCLTAMGVPVFAQDDESSSKDAESSASKAASSVASSAEAKSTSDSAESSLPVLSSQAGLTDRPTLTGGNAIPTYPAPAVPDTKDAPFMKQSSAPEGTVFIAVGAILGAFGVAIVLWRAIVGLLLHRSVERATKAQHNINTKSGFPAPPAPFYKYTDQDSAMSVAAGSGRGTRRTNRGPVPSSNLSQSNLFFSPTANTNAPGNRGSSYLPSGFYAASSTSPGPQHQDQAINMQTFRPESIGHNPNGSRHTLNGSPPDSPQFGARRDLSTSSINLASPLQPGQRAPSAYLDDLLADDPTALPPPQINPDAPRRR